VAGSMRESHQREKDSGHRLRTTVCAQLYEGRRLSSYRPVWLRIAGRAMEV